MGGEKKFILLRGLHGEAETLFLNQYCGHGCVSFVVHISKADTCISPCIVWVDLLSELEQVVQCDRKYSFRLNTHVQ